MRTPVITRFTKNVRSLSTRRGLAAIATTVVLAGGVQILTTDTAWACAGPYEANNPTISAEARARHHDGAPVAGFVAPAPASLTAGSSAELGVEFGNFTGADYDEAAPSLSLLSPSGVANRPLLKYLTVEAMRDGSWKQLTIDDGCLGEAIRVDTSPLLQHLANGRASRVMFRVSLAADAPKELASLSITTSAWAEVGGTGKSASTTVKVLHTPARPTAAPTAEPTRSAKPAPAKTAKPAEPAREAQPAADETKAAPAAPAAEAPKSPAASPTSTPATTAPATTAPAGTAELAHTGSSETNTFLAASAAALLALGAGVLLAVRRLRPQR